jgi:hypothetical protein
MLHDLFKYLKFKQGQLDNKKEAEFLLNRGVRPMEILKMYKVPDDVLQFLFAKMAMENLRNN